MKLRMDIATSWQIRFSNWQITFVLHRTYKASIYGKASFYSLLRWCITVYIGCSAFRYTTHRIRGALW